MKNFNLNVCERLDKAHSVLNAFIPFASSIAFRMYRNVRYLNPEAFDHDIESVLILARLYHKRRYYGKAFELYSVAANAGDVRGLRKIGDCYFYGYGVQVNYSLAFANYQAASTKNDELSFEKLGRCYDMGMGCPQSYSSAHCWYDLASYHGDKRSIKRLGDFYRYGLHVEQNEAKAVQYYRKGTELNHRESILALADCYLRGDGVEYKKPISAFFLHIKAAMVETD